MLIEPASTIIALEEGFRTNPYYCSLGYPTVGYGIKIGDKGDPLPKFKIPHKVAFEWLQYEIASVEDKLYKFISDLSPVRQSVLISMGYQMGTTGLFKFKNMWKAIEEEDFSTAYHEMLDSLWARQTPKRAQRHAEMFLNDELLEFYK